MNKALMGAAAVIIPYAIFIASIETDTKSLLVGILCAIILIYYVKKAGGWQKLGIGGRVLTIPTILLLTVLIFNLLFSLGIHPIILWASYVALTVLAFIVSFKTRAQ